MIATGIIRRIDDLGRIVIPKEIRRQLKVTEGEPFEIFLTKEGEVILKPYRPQEYTLRKGDFWEELIAPSGKVVCGNHRLNATEILDALGIQYTEEELESDEEEDQSSSFSIPAPRQTFADAVFYYITTSINLSREKCEKVHKFLSRNLCTLSIAYFSIILYYNYRKRGNQNDIRRKICKQNYSRKNR